MDSLEKIEQELERHLDEYGDPGPEGYPIVEQVIQWALAEIRALRERDEKRWEIVRREEGFLRKLADGIPEGPDRYGIVSAADLLREAREGRDA